LQLLLLWVEKRDCGVMNRLQTVSPYFPFPSFVQAVLVATGMSDVDALFGIFFLFNINVVNTDR